MRKMLIVGSACLLIAGCNHTKNKDPRADDAAGLAAKWCGYLADVAPIAQIFASNIPGLSTATAVAQAICNAREKQKKAVGRGKVRAESYPVVGGVTVTGRDAR